jgi:hypothetical protein
MAASWTDEDEVRICGVVRPEEYEPLFAPPTEWSTDDGLGCMKGMRNAAPFFMGFWLFVAIALYLIWS